MDRYKQWAIRLSEALDDFIWLHSGGNKLNLNNVYRDSLNLMCSFRKELRVVDPLGLTSSDPSLKEKIQVVCSASSGELPFDDGPEAIVRAIADYIEHLDFEDDSCFECRKKICDKLRGEAV